MVPVISNDHENSKKCIVTHNTSSSSNNEIDVFDNKLLTSDENSGEFNPELNRDSGNTDKLLNLKCLHNENNCDSNDNENPSEADNGIRLNYLKLSDNLLALNEKELLQLKLDESCNSTNFHEVEAVLGLSTLINLDENLENIKEDAESAKELELCLNQEQPVCSSSIVTLKQNVTDVKLLKDNSSDLERKIQDKSAKPFVKRKKSSEDSHPVEDKLVPFMKELSMKVKLEELTSLSLINLGLKSVDYDFSPLVNVISIDFSGNELSSLPDSIGSFKQCSRLILSKNRLNEIPTVLYKYFYFIKELDISYNYILDFNMAPLCLTYIVHLNASHNKITTLPQWLLHDIPSSLKSLNFSFNPCFKERQVSFLSDTFETNIVCSRVTELDISNTGFNSMNLKVLKMFPCLKKLHISSMPLTSHFPSNSIDELPGDILNQMPLEELNAEGSALTCLPENIDKMSHLKILKVSRINISWFPEKIVHLECLSILVASKCCLAYLPKEMGCLTSLAELWLSDNDISSLPDLKNCTNLKVLDLYNNSFYQLPSTLEYLKLEAFDICANYLNPATYKQCSDDMPYENLKIKLREKLDSQGSRKDSIKIDNRSSQSSYSGSYSSSLKSWGSEKSSRSRRSTLSLSFDRQSAVSSKEDESWDVDPDDAWDPDLYSDMHKWTSDDSLSRCRFLASLTHRDHYFCPYRERSNFHQNLYLGYSGADEQGQFEDA